MKNSCLPRFVLVVLVCASFLLGFVPRQGLAQQDLPGVFTEILEVRVVNLEVVVTDKNGVRVSGLKPEDFRLWVDGEEVPIEYFTEILGGDAVEYPEAPEGIVNVPAVTPGDPVGTSYLVFIDDYFGLPNDRNRVLEALREQLQLLGPEDRMALVAYDGQQLEMISVWSQSAEALHQALEAAQRRPAYGMQRIAERRSADLQRRLPSNLRFRRFTTDTRLDIEERFYADLLTDQVERVVMAATATLRSFAAPPGRKVMLLVSGGWPFSPVEYAVDAFARPVFEPDYPRGDELFGPLTETANLLGYTLYPVDAPGVQSSGDAGSTLRADAISPFSVSFERETETHFALEYLAEETGGDALLNSQRNEPLEIVASDTRSYYWLGFTPGWKGDDEAHEIRVEVQRSGLSARSRQGFLDYSREREVSMMVESALLFGNPPTPYPLEVQIGRVQRSRNRMTVSLKISIPADAVTFLPSGEQYGTQLELRLAGLDEDGGSVTVPPIPLNLSLPEAPQEGQALTYETSLKMRRKAHSIVVAVYDPASGTILSSTLEVQP